MEAKSDLELPDQQGNTPLHLAAEGNFSAACGCGVGGGRGLEGWVGWVGWVTFDGIFDG